MTENKKRLVVVFGEVCADMKPFKFSYVTDKRVKWKNTLEKLLTQLITYLPYDPAILFLCIFSK